MTYLKSFAVVFFCGAMFFPLPLIGGAKKEFDRVFDEDIVTISELKKGQKLSFCEANESLFVAPVAAFWQSPFLVFTNIANSLKNLL